MISAMSKRTGKTILYISIFINILLAILLCVFIVVAANTLDDETKRADLSTDEANEYVRLVNAKNELVEDMIDTILIEYETQNNLLLDWWNDDKRPTREQVSETTKITKKLDEMYAEVDVANEKIIEVNKESE